ncbi:heterokaryon incompatibility protein domain-containing protein [Trichoderma chlorosporum]
MQYEQLDDRPGSDHIWILSLAPSQNVSDPIHMELSNVSLADKPTYEALSYCWGDVTKRMPVICNRNQFHVTENLDSALRHLRLETEERTLWVDAICIDQTNIFERSFQVSLMQRIYRLAERVVVWLGDGEAGSNLVFPLCEKMFKERSSALRDLRANTDILLGPDRETFMKQKLIEAKKRAKEAEDEDDESQENTNSDSVKPNSQDSKEDDNTAVDEGIDVSDPSDEEISALLQLLARPWFYRSWIVQEVSLAQEAVILCGTNSIDWNVFAMGFMHAVCLSSKGPRGRPVQIHRSPLLLIAILQVKLLDSDDTYYSDLNILWC